MSNFGTHQTQKALCSAATVEINKYMARESAANIANLQAKQAQTDNGANI